MVKNIQETDRIVVDLEMLQIDYNEQKKNALRKEISEKYGVPEKNITINFNPTTVSVDGKRVSLADDVVDNVQDPAHQKNMMRHYIELNEYQDVNWDDIDTIDNQVNAFIDFDQYSKYKNYKFKYVKWSNYLSYGEDNFFDFTKLHGLVLLNSDPANQGGKTTFAIDLLRFALFGKADKSPNLATVFNSFLPEATTVFVEACIEIDGEDYVIRRTITRPSLKKRTARSKCTQKLEYFKKNGDDLELIENCEGENVQQTNNIIRDAVGNVDDFNLVISATSYSLGELLRMGQTDKGRLFSRWLGLLSIEEKEAVAKKLWKENYQGKLMSDKYNKETLGVECEGLEARNIELTGLIDKALTEKNDAIDRINTLNADKVELLTSMKPIKDGLDSLDMTTLENQKNSLSQSLETTRAEFRRQKADYANVKDAKYDEEAHKAVLDRITELSDEKQRIEIENAGIKTKIGIIRGDVGRIKELCEKGVCPTCGHPIEKAEQDGFIDEKMSEENSLIEIGKENKAKIDGIVGEINQLKVQSEQFETAKSDVTKKAQLELKMSATHTNIENTKMKIDKIDGTLSDMVTNEENIKHNNEIKNKVAIIDATIKSEGGIRDARIADIESMKKDMSSNTEGIDERKKLITKLIEEERLIRNWNLYLELVGKNGIVKLVLKDALPIINNEVARILDGLCDFDVRLEIDEKNNVMMNLVKDGVVMDLGTAASGFESTMACLALRSALAGISTMSKPNFLTIDECLQGVAVENYDNVKELYNRIIGNYDFIIHITHNELLYDWHTQHISVVKNGNISSISFNDTMK